jgi:hypothetical protein
MLTSFGQTTTPESALLASERSSARFGQAVVMPGDRYRAVIERLVREAKEGQGQIGPKRVRAGVWNKSATVSAMPDQQAINDLIAGMSKKAREVLARLLEESYVAGVHDTLVALNEAQIEPFEDGYEDSPFHDFMGRLHGWEWPT